jgi:hypothetical protein
MFERRPREREMVMLRHPTQADWSAIAALADQSVAHIPEAPRQSEWVGNRQAFRGMRCHYVVHDETLLAYGSFEQAADEGDGAARLFLVVDWRTEHAIPAAQLLLEQLRKDAATLALGKLWVREYALDRPFLDFLMGNDFHVTQTYERGGQRIVNLTTTVSGSFVSKASQPVPRSRRC